MTILSSYLTHCYHIPHTGDETESLRALASDRIKLLALPRTSEQMMNSLIPSTEDGIELPIAQQPFDAKKPCDQ